MSAAPALIASAAGANAGNGPAHLTFPPALVTAASSDPSARLSASALSAPFRTAIRTVGAGRSAAAAAAVAGAGSSDPQAVRPARDRAAAATRTNGRREEELHMIRVF